MNPCERIARLNPTSIRFDVGRGGKPELTPQDIAGAIGMVKNVFAREVFCAIWWPDGAQLVWRQLDLMIGALQFGEWRERMDAMVTAQICVAQAVGGVRSEREKLGRAKLMLEKAKENMWPAIHEEAYALMRGAVIEELRANRICPICNGRKQAVVTGLVVSCANCHGSGRIAVSDNKRAAAMKRDDSTFRRTWKPVYEWTLRMVADAEATGRNEIAARLEDAA